jgi:hypothetical protein
VGAGGAMIRGSKEDGRPESEREGGPGGARDGRCTVGASRAAVPHHTARLTLWQADVVAACGRGGAGARTRARAMMARASACRGDEMRRLACRCVIIGAECLNPGVLLRYKCDNPPGWGRALGCLLVRLLPLLLLLFRVYCRACLQKKGLMPVTASTWLSGCTFSRDNCPKAAHLQRPAAAAASSSSGSGRGRGAWAQFHQH